MEKLTPLSIRSEYSKFADRHFDIPKSVDPHLLIDFHHNARLGCGSNIFNAKIQPGERILDIGCGSGFDVILAGLASAPNGAAIGLDFSEEMTAAGRTSAESLGVKNVTFFTGDAGSLPFEDNYFDVILSDCVINLCDNKDQVWNEIRRCLRHNGRIVLSDTVSKGNVPPEVLKSFSAKANCISNCESEDQFFDRLDNLGFKHWTKLSDYSVLYQYSGGEFSSADRGDDKTSHDVRTISVVAGAHKHFLPNLNSGITVILGFLPDLSEKELIELGTIIQFGLTRAKSPVGRVNFIEFVPQSGEELADILTKNKVDEISKGVSVVTFEEAFYSVVSEFNTLCGKVDENIVKVGLLADNKSAFRQALSKHCPHRNPNYRVSDNIEELKLVAQDIGFPLVLKPSNDGNSRLVKLCDNEKDVVSFATDIFNERSNLSGLNLLPHVLLEDYLLGQEYSADIVVIEGHIEFVAFCEKTTAGAPNFFEVEHQYPARLTEKNLTSALEALVDVIGTLSCSDIVAHIEFKFGSDDEVQIIEANIRPPGGKMAWMLSTATGIDLVSIALRMQLGMPISDLNQTKFLAATYKCWHVKERSRVFFEQKDISVTSEIEPFLKIDIEPGKIVEPLVQPNGVIIGRAICFGNSREAAIELASDIEEKLSFRFEATDHLIEKKNATSAWTAGCC